MSLQEQKRLPGAVFLVALTTVAYEVLLTRVFSLTLWYHFAFMAISIAMFGMTLGALLVFLRPQAWPQERLGAAMARSALLLAATMVAAVFLHVYLFLPRPQALPVLWTFLAAAVPFAFSGIFICLALTRFPGRVGQLYGADLIGAAGGCLFVIAALAWLDGIGAVLACASLAALGGALLANRPARLAGIALSAALGATAFWSALHLAREEVAAFPIPFLKGAQQNAFDYERWNSFSRITVTPPNDPSYATAWSLSTAYNGPLKVESRWLQIDAGAGTQLIRFDGDLAKLEFLRWDLVNFVHHLRRDGTVCIVGAGGGRDILTAKLFGQKRVVAVEINPNIMRVVNQRFGDFTGHLDRDPRVQLVNDEARSYLARSSERCGIVQVTFIDTWAATAAGAYVLTENTLYTVEGWKLFIERLEDDGLLAVARGLSPEIGRMVALAREALKARGVVDPERHMVLVTNPGARPPQSFGPMGILLVRKNAFPQEALAEIRRRAEELRFEIELDPTGAGSPLLRALATGQGLAKLIPEDGPDYDAPTDDRPFFFNMQRFSLETLRAGVQHPVGLLMALLIGVAVLSTGCLVLPLALSKPRLRPRDASLLAFFAAIGAGFMLIEIAMLQRLTVFLGHPAYSLGVILFVLLLATGLGSRLSAALRQERLRTHGAAFLAVLLLALAAIGAATMPLVEAFQGSQTPARVALAAALLAAMGVPMGIAFPLGMRVALASRTVLAPWLWAVNGALSVFASVLAMVLAMSFGISVSYWAGVGCYAVALAAFALAAGSRLADCEMLPRAA